MNQQLTDQIRSAVAENPVYVFMKGTPEQPRCGFSKAVCDVLRTVGTPFAATDVLVDLLAYREALSSITAWPTIPQVFINGEFVGGCDIVVEMYRSGELQRLLAETAGASGKN